VADLPARSVSFAALRHADRAQTASVQQPPDTRASFIPASSASLHHALRGLEITFGAGIIAPFRILTQLIVSQIVVKDDRLIGRGRGGTAWPSTFADIVEDNGRAYVLCKM